MHTCGVTGFPFSRQAFVKMVGHHVSFLEAHVLQAERDHGALSQALRKWLGSSGLPAFRNVSIPHLPAPSKTLERGGGSGSGSSKGTAAFCRQEAASGWVGGWPGGWGVTGPPSCASAGPELLQASVLWLLTSPPPIS